MKAYKIVMMSKHEIPIEASELKKVLRGIASNSPVILKQGIFNPSAYSHIIEDKTRGEKLVDERVVDAVTGKYIGEVTMKYEALPDIFEGIEALAELKSAEVKRLKN